MSTLTPAPSSVRWQWILDQRNDLIWYIGSAGVGWLYILLILSLASQTTQDPLHDVITTWKMGGVYIPITLHLLVILSWSYLIDSPHVFATLARVLFDPEERDLRRADIRKSWLWFIFGPLFIFLPYLVGAILAPWGVHLSQAQLDLGWLVYFVFFRLWAYYHVVRQHWGFFSLYKRKNGDFEDEFNNKIDVWFFNLSLYLPLILFMTSTFYAQTPGFPDLGLRQPIWGQVSIGQLIYPLAFGLYTAVIIAYLGWQVYRWQKGGFLNGPKLLLLLAILPLHFVAFSHPLLVVFLVPLVTVGHNIQYHRIIWSYGQNKYQAETRPGYAFARQLFTHLPLYMLMGLLFTFALYNGPWIEFIKGVTGIQLDKSLLNSLSMMAGVANPAELQLGEKIFAAFLTGWAMQHYYLDAKIWRVRRDPLVQKNLKVD